MSSENNLIYIFTMLECIEKIWIYSKEFTNPDEFVSANDQKELNATISLFVAIGEESKKIDKSLKDLTNFNWKSIAGLRDKISHNYRGVDGDVLWAIIKNDLEQLKSTLIDIIKLMEPESSLIKEFLTYPYYKHIAYLKDYL